MPHTASTFGLESPAVYPAPAGTDQRLPPTTGHHSLGEHRPPGLPAVPGWVGSCRRGR